MMAVVLLSGLSVEPSDNSTTTTPLLALLQPTSSARAPSHRPTGDKGERRAIEAIISAHPPQAMNESKVHE